MKSRAKAVAIVHEDRHCGLLQKAHPRAAHETKALRKVPVALAGAPPAAAEKISIRTKEQIAVQTGPRPQKTMLCSFASLFVLHRTLGFL